LQKVYDLSNAMVKKLGMSEKIGYMSFKEHEVVKIYSEKTQKVGFKMVFEKVGLKRFL